MECRFCHFKNREDARFCVECGQHLVIECPICHFYNAPTHNFCSKCGNDLRITSRTEKKIPWSIVPDPSNGSFTGDSDDYLPFDGERKHITVLFSDLSGYTAIAETIDPEELKEIMGGVFRVIVTIIQKYEGHVERIIGDEVMALFGAPIAHEDDPIRAIKAAREIHKAVKQMSPEIFQKTGHPITMHTGINTGLVVTGRVSQRDGTHGVAGDTVNLASRLADMSKADEILVGPNTHRQSSGLFRFDTLPATAIKGKKKPMIVYRALAPKRKPITIHQPSGLQSAMIGRENELSQLLSAHASLSKGSCRVFGICGEAGTGKSRLIQEFKSRISLSNATWLEGHAYAHTQNVPYFPVIDLLNRKWGIDDGAPAQVVKNKIEKGIGALFDTRDDIVPFIGRLHGLSYPELDGMSPEVWNAKLFETLKKIFTAMGEQNPLVVYLEDLHWADTASCDLLHALIADFETAAIFLCVYRPTFLDFTNSATGNFRDMDEIRLTELSTREAQSMLKSILDTDEIPGKLRRFIRDRAEGNPFYIEELVNALVESGLLTMENGSWRLTGSFRESDIPSTVHGVISARLDRLDKQSKRVLQEASVIGRAFLYDILKKITIFKDEIDRRFTNLERIDLVRKRTLQPDLEFVFKHALTQEVGYSSLLKKERQQIHVSIAQVIELLFKDRLSEFYETLAMHYRRGKSDAKALEYLIKTGKKVLKQYALDAADIYFREAFELARQTKDPTVEKERVLMDVIIDWSFVYYYRGDNKGLIKLLNSHQYLAEALDDRERVGMYFALMGCAHWHKGAFVDSYNYLTRALRLGEEAGSPEVVGYACVWMTWICSDLGKPEEAIASALKAQQLYREDISKNHYIYWNSLSGLGYTYWHMGKKKETRQIGETLLSFGKQHSNLRSIVLGHCCIGWAHLISGNLEAAVYCFSEAVAVSVDPWYAQFPKLALCYGHVSCGSIQQGENQLNDILDYSSKSGADFIGGPARFFRCLIQITKGETEHSLHTMETMLAEWKKSGCTLRFLLLGFALARVYATMATSRLNDDNDRDHTPATQKAMEWFRTILDTAKKTQAKGILGQCRLHMGLLYRDLGEIGPAAEHLSLAVQILSACEADVYLLQARKALRALPITAH